MYELAKKLLEAKKTKDLQSISQFKDSEIVGKKFEITLNRKAVSINEEKKTAIFVMSTANIDRHGDIIDQDSWILDYFLESPMFFLQHRSDEFPLGKWIRVWFEDDPDNVGKTMLLGEAEFAVDLGDDIKRAWEHVKRGDMSSVSVGFIPHRVDYDEEKDAFILYDCELLECSLVGVGSNRQAKIKADEVKIAKTVEKMTEVRSELNAIIKNKENDFAVIAHYKAMQNLNKAIRLLK